MDILEFCFSALAGFSTQIAIGALLFCWNMKKRPHFWCRLLVLLPFCLGPTVVREILEVSFYLLPFFFVGWYAYIFMAMMVILSLLVWFCFDGPYLHILYYCAASRILQNLAYMVRSVLEELAFPEPRGLIYQAVTFCVDLLIWYLAYRFLVRRITREEVSMENRSLVAFCIGATLIVDVLHYWTYAFHYLNLATLTYDAACCVLLLALQFGIFDRSKQRMERQIMARIYGAMERQQSLSRENIDIINRKCHDLKHQIARLRRAENTAEPDQFLQELEDAVGIYDSIAKTGNDVLDTILTEKSLLCEQYKINMTIIADGEQLGFIEPSDLYSLFGNALDNAIESVCQEQEEHRIISLYIAEKSGIVTVQIDNYCSTPLRFENGLPVTTKEDNGYHGFGVQSIRYIVNKYNGTFAMRQDLAARRVVLSIAFPAAQGG